MPGRDSSSYPLRRLLLQRNLWRRRRCGQASGPIDVAIALDHISLQATQLGLATCWVGSFYTEKVRKILAIPDDITIVELMALGYPADEQRNPKREPIEKILCYEKWRF